MLESGQMLSRLRHPNREYTIQRAIRRTAAPTTMHQMALRIRRLEETLCRVAPRWFPAAAFFRFCIVALVLGIPGAGVLFLLVEYAGIHYLVAGVINCLGMTVLSYYFNSIYTYRRFIGTGGFLRFFTSRVGSVALGTLMYVLLTAAFGLWYLVASLLSAAFANLLTFALSHLWVWSSRPHDLRLVSKRTGGER